MKEIGQPFFYTARRYACLNIIVPFLVIATLEASAWVLLFLALPIPYWFKGVGVGVNVLLIAFLLGFLLAPLRTHHVLTKELLILHYGFDRLQIPRAWLVAAQPTQERFPVLYGPRMKIENGKKRLMVTFSDQALVLLLFKEEHQLRLHGKTIPIESILLNVDDRQTFLSSLGLPEKRGESSHSPLPSSEKEDVKPLDIPRLAADPSMVASVGEVALSLSSLARKYGEIAAVVSLNLNARFGEIYGFLGSNGAGKTTTLKMIAGLITPDSGSIILAGHNLQSQPEAAKAVLGYVPDRAILYERLTGREMLTFEGLLRGLTRSQTEERIEQYISLLDLQEYADRLCETYSFGTKRKLALVMALLHHPTVLVLDEPFNGLDPRSAHSLKNLLHSLAKQGTAILLSTHDLATVESLCQRLGIISRGQLILEGEVPDLLQSYAVTNLEELFLQVTA